MLASGVHVYCTSSLFSLWSRAVIVHALSAGSFSHSHVKFSVPASRSGSAVKLVRAVTFGVILVEQFSSIVGVEIMTSYVSPEVSPSSVTVGELTTCESA